MTELTLVRSRVMFPAYSMLQGDPARLRRAFRRSVEAIAFAAAPFSIGLAIVAGDLTRDLLGPAWVGALLNKPYRPHTKLPRGVEMG